MIATTNFFIAIYLITLFSKQEIVHKHSLPLLLLLKLNIS